jgi:hypothetical protein
MPADADRDLRGAVLYVHLMAPRTLRRTFAALVAVAAGALVAGQAIAPADTGGHASAAAKITPKRVDGVRLGATFKSLRAAGKVGRLRPGCELGGPSTRSARLRSPLKGSVDFTLTNPRKVTTISITGGAKARGVGIGATIAQIKAAFPKAIVDHSSEPVFASTFVRIPKSGGGRMMFSVPTATGKTDLIGVPRLALCE